MDNLLANNITELIGNTPAVKLPGSFTKNQFEVICKFEVFNPGGSIKDRPAKFMIDAAENCGKIRKS